MKADDERSGRCGVVALVLAACALPGIASGSLFGGLAAVRSVADILGQPLATSGVAGQLFVLAGMVAGLLVSSGIIMFLIMAASRMAKRLRELRTACRQKRQEAPLPVVPDH